MARPIIPRFEPEIVAAVAAKMWRGDDEKVATTSRGCIEYLGVQLESRYSKAHEIEVMMAMVDGVSAGLRPYCSEIFCDSKATACYSVKFIDDCSSHTARAIGRQMEKVCLANRGGHNGIHLSGSGRFDDEIGPNWVEWDP